jgi:hypothetical protein
MKYATDAMKESRVPDFLVSVGALTTAMDVAIIIIIIFSQLYC